MLLDYQSMNAIDLIVIYLAIGAPFAVYVLTTRQLDRRNATRRAAEMWLLWPLIGVMMLSRRIAAGPSSENTRRNALATLRSQIEEVACRRDSFESIVEFRN